MSADGAPVEAAAPEGQEEGISPALQARFDELGQTIQELRSSVPQYQRLSDQVGQPPQQEQQSPDQQQWEAPPAEDPYYDPMAEQQQAMAQLEQYISTQVDQRVNPFIQQQQMEVRQRQAVELEAKYPDLQKPEVAGPLIEQASRYAQQLGYPDLAGDPRFIENFYLAQTAGTNAAQQTAADGGNEVHIEGAGAAPQAQEMEPGDDMLIAWGKDPNTAFG